MTWMKLTLQLRVSYIKLMSSNSNRVREHHTRVSWSPRFPTETLFKMLSSKNPQINDEYEKNKIWMEYGWTFVPLLSLLGTLHRKWKQQTGPRESEYIYPNYGLFGRVPVAASLHFWDSVFQRTWFRVVVFSEKTTYIPRTHNSVCARICLGVGYVWLRFHLCNYACNMTHALVACVGATVCKSSGMRKMGAQGVHAR
jgi:hypothetical protein